MLGLGPGEPIPLVRKSGEDLLRLGRMRLLAFEVRGELGVPAPGFAARHHDPLELLFEAVAGLGQALEPGCRSSIGLTQWRQGGFGRFAGLGLARRALVASATARSVERRSSALRSTPASATRQRW